MYATEYREKCFRHKERECVVCGSTDNIVVHHNDGDRDNNNLDNLTPLCDKHHKKVHGYRPAEDTIEMLRAKLGDEQPTRGISLDSYRYTCPDGHTSVSGRESHFHCDGCYKTGDGIVHVIIDKKTGERLPREHIHLHE